VTVSNLNTPEVNIRSPRSYSQYTQGDTIYFSAWAPDVEDGDLSNGLVWTSDYDGELGRGASFEIDAAKLTPGSHIITASVSDRGGRLGQNIVIVTVQARPPTVTVQANTPPTITIHESPSGWTFYDDWVTFSGTADDTEDGELTKSLEWKSVKDNVVAYGGMPGMRLSWGVHTITVTVADSLGARSTETIIITLIQR